MDRASIQERFGIIGSSPAIRNVLDRVRQVSQADITVLVEGESGVGKELVAHAIHELSPRRHGSLIIVNCGAIPEGLIESELFGAEKGAYTGAVERRSGYFEDADRGTIFLDEIGEMPQAAQVRLLRVLETGEFSRVGSSAVRRSDVRVIAATNKDLAREVQAGRFREDLYYRLSTVVIHLAPLRERREDILPLFEHFTHRFAQKYNSPMKRLDEGARQLLMRYHWPGNIRELRNVAEQAVVLLRGDAVTADDLRSYLRGVSARDAGGLLPVQRGGAADPSEARERELVYRALLELRLEVRELKEQIGRLVSGGSLAVPREVLEREEFDADRGDYVIVREADRAAFGSLIEDVPYEIEPEEERASVPAPLSAPPARASRPSNGAHPLAAPHPEPDAAATGATATDDAAHDAAHDASLPTLADAERELILRALRHYDGNRRQTARALGISERTLYRKLKELDEEV